MELLPVAFHDEGADGTPQIFQTEILSARRRFVHDSRNEREVMGDTIVQSGLRPYSQTAWKGCSPQLQSSVVASVQPTPAIFPER
jgi:hypothetical protein